MESQCLDNSSRHQSTRNMGCSEKTKCFSGLFRCLYVRSSLAHNILVFLFPKEPLMLLLMAPFPFIPSIHSIGHLLSNSACTSETNPPYSTIQFRIPPKKPSITTAHQTLPRNCHPTLIPKPCLRLSGLTSLVLFLQSRKREYACLSI